MVKDRLEVIAIPPKVATIDSAKFFDPIRTPLNPWSQHPSQ
jgi:hypothetical protein